MRLITERHEEILADVHLTMLRIAYREFRFTAARCRAKAAFDGISMPSNRRYPPSAMTTPQSGGTGIVGVAVRSEVRPGRQERCSGAGSAFPD
jgi:hypothetical protein